MKTYQMTLDENLVRAVDRVVKKLRTSRSAFTRAALRDALVKVNVTELERRDLEIINRRADDLNAEAEDVLTYQVPL